MKPMMFRNLSPRRRELLLVVLMTLSWTMGFVLAVVGWAIDDRKWYIPAALSLASGFSFFETWRHARVSEADDDRSSAVDP